MNIVPAPFETEEKLVTEIRRVRPSDIELPVIDEMPIMEENDGGAWRRERFFGALFYFLAAATGLVVAQLIWQIAVVVERI